MSNVLDIFKIETPAKRWLEQNLNHQDREFCLIWPFSRAQNGYGAAGKAGYIRPHRIMCEHRHGPPPTPQHQAAHSCNRGHDACVNPWHLDWKTPSENQLDRFQNYEPTPRRKLTPDQVDEIRALQGRERTVDTAARFHVTEANIRQIQSGKTWKLENIRARQFTADEIYQIRSTPWQVKTANQWAKEFGVHRGTIDRIREGRSYRYYPMPDAPSPQESAESNKGNSDVV